MGEGSLECKNNANLSTSGEELWVYLASRLLASFELPMVQFKREIFAFDLARFVRNISEEIIKNDPSRQTCQDSYHHHFLVINVANHILSEVRELKRFCLESSHIKNLIQSIVLSFKRPIVEEHSKDKPSAPIILSIDRISVILRNGKSVAWNSEKIFQAVLKALLAQNMHGVEKKLTSEVLAIVDKQAAAISNRVNGHILSRRRTQVYLEEIQDCVEFTLDEMGLLELKKLYSEYRKERFLVRTNKTLEASCFLLSELVTPDLLTRIDIASIGLSLIHSKNEIASFLVKTMNVVMNKKERAQTILLNARSLIEQEADYRLFASRILLTFIYEEVLDWSVQDGMFALKQAHMDGFSRFINRGIEIGLLDKRCLDMNLSRLASFINPLADFQFDFLGIYTLYDRYFLHERSVDKSDGPPILNNSGKRRLEVPQYVDACCNGVELQ